MVVKVKTSPNENGENVMIKESERNRICLQHPPFPQDYFACLLCKLSYNETYSNRQRVSLKTCTDFCAKIQQAIGPHEDLLTIVKRRKLQWYGHVSRSSGLAKTILQGTV